MGNIDSIPVVSQVKSLVQVIGGDEEGAKKTQEKFAREAPVVSQVNSYVQAVQGNNEEAKKIQEEFAGNAVEVAKGIPVVGYGMSAYYAIDGDTEKAKALALQTTKGTVVAAAGAAGILCGPGAPACAAGLTVAASTGWDATESGIRGEKVGSIKAWDNLVHGKSSVGEGFDLIGGTVLEAGAAAIGARGGAKFGSGKVGGIGGKVGGIGGKVGGIGGKVGGIGGKVGGIGGKVGGIRGKAGGIKGPGNGFRGGLKSPVYNPSRCIGKRSATDGFFFERNLPDIPDDLNSWLPGSVSELSFDESMSGDSIIDNVLGIFFVLKLMSIGHLKSKPYYNEICTSVYPTLKIEECSTMLFKALTKYEDDTPADDTDYKAVSTANHTLFTDLLDGVEFEMMSLSKDTIMGHILEVAACNVLGSETTCLTLEKKLKQGLSKIVRFIQRATTKIRRTRQTCLRRTFVNSMSRYTNGKVKYRFGFERKHGLKPGPEGLKDHLAKVDHVGQVVTEVDLKGLQEAFDNGRIKYKGPKDHGAESFETLDKIKFRDAFMKPDGEKVTIEGKRYIEVFEDGRENALFHLESTRGFKK